MFEPKIRVNERSFADFNDNLASQKIFKFNDKNKDVGMQNTYRSVYEDLNIKQSNQTLTHYPYDEVFVTMRLELVSFNWKEYVIIYNLHNVSQVPL